MPLSTWLDTPCGQWCSFFSTIASSKVVRKTCCQARDVWWDATSKSRRLFAAAAIAQYSIWIYVLSLGSWLSFFRGKKLYSIHVFMQRLFEIHTLLSSMRKSKVLKFKILFDIEFFSSNQDFLIRKIKEPELNFNIFSNILYSEYTTIHTNTYLWIIKLPKNHTLCLLDTTSKGSSSPASLANLGGS